MTNSSFASTLFQRANNYFYKNPAGKYATPLFYIKGLALLALYIAAYISFVFLAGSISELITLACCIGILHVFIPVSISHDAIHNSISEKKWINDMAKYGFEITGSNSYMYARKHLEAHFNKENGSKALAIESQGLLLQKQNTGGAVNLPVYFYLFYAQYMIYIRDFILFFNDTTIPFEQWIRLVVTKAVYTTAFLVLPFIYVPLPWWQVLIAIVCMYFVVTAFLVIILLMPTEKMKHSKGNQGNDTNDQWLIEVLEHNVDFSPGSRSLNLLAGGANMNVVHYLFPSVNHVHYHQLAKIIENTANEYSLLYRKQQVKDVLGIHFNYLKNITGTRYE